MAADSERRTKVLNFLTITPILYLALLVPLAEIGFAHKCDTWPMCGIHGGGISVASLIETPQATGMFAAVFYWPMCHLWSLKGLVHQRHRDLDRSGAIGDASLFVIFAAAAVYLVVPVSLFPGVKSGAASVFCGVSVAHYWLMLMPLAADKDTGWVSRARRILIVGSLCFTALGLLQFCSFFGGGLSEWRVEWNAPPWVAFLLEVLELSCLALVPVLLHTEVKAPATNDSGQPRSVRHPSLRTQLMDSFGWGGQGLLCLLTVAPTVYVWSLPLLAEEVRLDPCPGEWAERYGCAFSHQCSTYPNCGITGLSVSNYICTPQATGAMAVVFFIPLCHVWSIMERHHWSEELLDFTTFMLFYGFFGAFLSIPVDHPLTKPFHFAAVACFCMGGLAHSKHLLDRARSEDVWRLRACFGLAVLGVVLVAVTKIVQFGFKFLDDGSRYVAFHYPHLFWADECLGLSAITIFPWLWRGRAAEAKPPAANNRPLLGGV